MEKVHRFKELYAKAHEKMGELNLLEKAALLVDVSWEKFVYGTSREDYFQYGFYLKNNRARRTYINRKRAKQIVAVSNDKQKSKIFADKEKFVEVFDKFVGRSILNMNKATFEEFSAFCDQHGRGFVKPRGGTYGRGVEIIDLSGEIDRKAVYDKLRAADVLLEEVIVQHPWMAELNGSSLNSLRVVTYLCADGHSEIMPGAVIRVGRSGRIADNFHHNGIGAQIDIETGIVCSTGVDKNANRYIVHPDTGASVLGFRIPLWDEVCKTVLQAAKVVPEVRYVGWDVAITKDNTIVLVEGNDRADPDLGQMSDGIGKWHAFKEKIDAVAATK